ncbi:MAG: ACT domain-containing protein [Leptolyngbya sp. SIO1D8]|nr:ACT domain-containing protein [Leptolyngbya sp. SIO1D8]
MPSPVGEENLDTLLASLHPHLHPAVYVFCTLENGKSLPSSVVPICQFQEAESLTLIVDQEQAKQASLPSLYPCRMITLRVHSSLAAVGLLAKVAQALAMENISVNAISAYYHDHLFVPCDRAEDAMICLQQLALQTDSH